MIRKIAKQLPLINNVLNKKLIPRYEGWYWCKYYSWDMDKKDYIELVDIFYFDGNEFHTERLCDYDAADWIFEIVDIVGEKDIRSLNEIHPRRFLKKSKGKLWR